MHYIIIEMIQIINKCQVPKILTKMIQVFGEEQGRLGSLESNVGVLIHYIWHNLKNLGSPFK